MKIKQIALTMLTVAGTLFLSHSAFATTAPVITDFISTTTLEPISNSILSVLGTVVTAAFVILGFGVAAKVGFGVIKSFFSRAAS